MTSTPAKRQCNCAGPMTISSYENVRRWVHCPSCGKVCKVKANSLGIATIRPHNEPVVISPYDQAK